MKYFLLAFFLSAAAVCFSQTIFLKQPPSNVDCQTKEEKEADRNQIMMLKQAYFAQRDSSSTASTHRTLAGHILLGWPMRATAEYDFMYNYFNLQNYVDQDEPGSGDEDYHCNSRTYDGHDAADINLWPFWWRMMDNNYVMAVAAAPGIILSKNDGFFDRNCTATGSPNSVTLLHDDGTTTRYLHLKKNSLTSKVKDDRVEQGEFLGYIGSSGRSSFPHLHFAVYDSSNNLVEPFFDAANASCNVYNQETWWQNQRNYWEPQINRLMTHSAVPSLEWCPGDEVVNAKNQFSSGEILYTGIAFMDGQNGDVANCTLTRPNGTVTSWNVTLGETNSRIYAVNAHLLPAGNTGTWVYRATYRSKVYAHFFTVGCIATETPSGSISGNDGYITSNLISSTAIHTGSSNTKVLYQSANTIELKPGFEARAGIHFKARIKPCTYTE